MLGNSAMMRELQIAVDGQDEQANRLRLQGQTVMFLAVNRKAAGLLGVIDPIKATTPAAIKALHDEGLRIVMLTGDSRATAAAVASTLGIDDVAFARDAQLPQPVRERRR